MPIFQHQTNPATAGVITPHSTGRNAFRRNGIHVGRGLWRPFAVSRRKDMMDVADRDRQGV
jgi:hypothetical protein